MPNTPKPRAKKRVRYTPNARQACEIWSRTQMLVEIMLSVLADEVQSQEGGDAERWQRLFGPKDSAVTSLQKLVALLKELQAQTKLSASDVETVAPVSPEEMALLSEWLQANAANVSTEGER